MKNKAVAIALIALMAVSAIGLMPTNVKGADNSIKGYSINSRDGNVQYYDGTYYYGMINVTYKEGGSDYAWSQDSGGDSYSSGNDYVTFNFAIDKANPGGHPFNTPPGLGDHIYLYGLAYKDGMGSKAGDEPWNHTGNGVQNYTFCSNFTSDLGSGTVPQDTINDTATWEPINVSATGDPANTIRSGSDWMNITVQQFRFSSYQYKTPTWNHGSYENCVGFNATIYNKSSGKTTYVDITNYVDGPNAPAQSAPGATDPGSTGYWWVNLTAADLKSTGGVSAMSSSHDTIKLANSYVVTVRPMFADGNGGSVKTVGSEPISGEPITVPEFSTILVPIVATIGLFVAATYIYRKKD